MENFFHGAEGKILLNRAKVSNQILQLLRIEHKYNGNVVPCIVGNIIDLLKNYSVALATATIKFLVKFFRQRQCVFSFLIKYSRASCLPC